MGGLVGGGGGGWGGVDEGSRGREGAALATLRFAPTTLLVSFIFKAIKLSSEYKPMSKGVLL